MCISFHDEGRKKKQVQPERRIHIHSDTKKLNSTIMEHRIDTAQHSREKKLNIEHFVLAAQKGGENFFICTVFVRWNYVRHIFFSIHLRGAVEEESESA